MGASSLIFDVDYAVFDEGQQRFVHKISISGFSFAKKMLRPLYFVRPEINVDGEIVCTIRLSQTEESAHGIAEQFISFMGSKAIPGHEILIGDWFSDISGKSNARIAQ